MNNVTVDQDKILFKGEMLKINRKNNKTKQRFFILTKDNLFYLKSENSLKLRGLMKTKWVRVQYIKEEDEDGKMRYCVRFIKNMKYCDFIIKSNKEFQEWKKHLEKVFIQSNFHEKFTAIKMIGKGSFARVYLVENKQTLNKYAVKAFSKEYLLSQAKGK